MRGLREYRSIVFDCDGVLLNSNTLKTDAFHASALPFGHEAANALVDYHVKHGGVSRYQKFRYFLSDIAAQPTDYDIDKLIRKYADIVQSGLLTCEVAQGLEEFRRITASATWMVASGGDQTELREVFRHRGLDQLFDSGIHGSPTSKMDIIAREIELGNIAFPALLIGDSQYDHEVALSHNIDFAFVTRWSEFKEIKEYADSNNIARFSDISDLLACCF